MGIVQKRRENGRHREEKLVRDGEVHEWEGRNGI